MIELIQSLPFPLPTAGITHSWMGEIWMVDGEALVMTMTMILPKFPVPAGCQNGVSGSESWFLVAAAERNSFWKTIDPPEFLGQKATHRHGGRPRSFLGWPNLPQARGQWARVWGGSGPPGLPSVSPSGSVDLLVKYNFWHIFQDFS